MAAKFVSAGLALLLVLQVLPRLCAGAWPHIATAYPRCVGGLRLSEVHVGFAPCGRSVCQPSTFTPAAVPNAKNGLVTTAVKTDEDITPFTAHVEHSQMLWRDGDPTDGACAPVACGGERCNSSINYEQPDHTLRIEGRQDVEHCSVRDDAAADAQLCAE